MEGIKIDTYTAKEAMRLAVKYMQLESIQTIEMITPEAISYYQKLGNKEQADIYQDFNITLASESSVWKAAGVTDEKLLDEADSHLFMRLFIRYLHKNHAKVFLLAENEAVLEQMKAYISEYSSGIRVIETATLEENGVSDDKILNLINGAAADCIIAALPTPQQQDFIMRNRLLMNARVWIGLGTSFVGKKKKKELFAGIKELVNQFFTKM